MAKIKEITAREILDSRGDPTIETTVILDDNSVGISSVPAGLSVGKYEAAELRDNDLTRFNGKGVLKALKNIKEKITPKILGLEAQNQKLIDKTMVDLDGTANKSALGANSILSVSQATCKAAAASNKISLFRYINELVKADLPRTVEKMPTPCFNILNGGRHGGGNLDFQEFLVILPTAKNYHQGLELGMNLYNALRDILTNRGAIHTLGDEGGFAPNLFSNLDALEILNEAVKNLNLRLGYDVFFGIDAAAANFKSGNKYQIKDKPNALSKEELINYYINLNNQYRLLLLEDPFEEDDWESWIFLRENLGASVVIVGDDLVSTNAQRLALCLEKKALNCVIVKPNQIGTVSEALWFTENAQKANLTTIVSHRSGETNDTFIADFAVGVAANYVKFGAPARGERVAKYNRLLEIEREILKT